MKAKSISLNVKLETHKKLALLLAETLKSDSFFFSPIDTHEYLSRLWHFSAGKPKIMTIQSSFVMQISWMQKVLLQLFYWLSFSGSFQLRWKTSNAEIQLIDFHAIKPDFFFANIQWIYYETFRKLITFKLDLSVRNESSVFFGAVTFNPFPKIDWILITSMISFAVTMILMSLPII